MSGTMRGAIEAMQQRVVGISDREAVKCILQAIVARDFVQYITPGALLGEFNYKPYADMSIMRQTIDFQAQQINELKAQLQFYMKPVAGDGH